MDGGRILTYVRTDKNDLEDKKLIELNWDGTPTGWEYYNSNYSYLNHDFQRLPNGNTIFLCAINDMFDTNISVEPFRDDVIVEIDALSSNEQPANVVWEWKTSDHFEELGLSAEAKQIIHDRSQPWLDDPQTIFHTNSIQSLPPNRFEATDDRFKTGNILVSQRNTNAVFIIDKATKKIVWTMNDKTVGQHHASMIPEPLQGAGNILIFNNNGRAGYPEKIGMDSEVREINPLTLGVVWRYSALIGNMPKHSFFSPFKSSVQRLPNGNTLICESIWGRIFEVTYGTPDDSNDPPKLIWEYINPFRKLKSDRTNAVYRAYRIDAKLWKNGGIEPFYW